MKDNPKIIISSSQAQEINGVYDQLLQEIKSISKINSRAQQQDKLIILVDSAIEKLGLYSEPLLSFTSKVFDKDYGFSHALNVCLVSLKIGLRLKLNHKHLRALGFSALLHAAADIGLSGDSAQETDSPVKLKEIVQLADVYDALTRPPDYRNTMMPYETLVSIINSDGLFNRQFVKILLEEFTLYPKDSCVELSTKEIAKVVKPNKELLLRPEVEVFIDAQGEYLEEVKKIDLSRAGLIYILRAVSEDEVKQLKG